MLFGDYIKSLRESRGIALSDAARQLSQPTQKLWDIENNRRYSKQVPRVFLEKAAALYRLPVGVIIQATGARISEGKKVSEIIMTTLPELQKALELAGQIVLLSREYTPALESRSAVLYELIDSAKTKLENARDTLYPTTQRKKPKP